MTTIEKLQGIKERFPAIELFMLSAVSLFCELLVIRWLSSDFRSIAVLKTFPLVACFVGLGVGFAQKTDRWFRYSAIALTALVIFIRLSDLTGMSQLPYPTMTIYQWGKIEHFSPAMWTFVGFFMVWLALVLSAPFIFMCGLGARMAEKFRDLPALTAYCWNIAGAIFGSISFSWLSFLCAPPWLLLVPIILVMVWYGRSFVRVLIPLAVALAMAVIPVPSDAGSIWSPYFRLAALQVHADGSTERSDKSPVVGVFVKVNQMFQQWFFPEMKIVPDNSAFINKLYLVRKRYYQLPYELIKPESVLVLGCGVGQDVRAAFQSGAKNIDGVEIDPVVLSLGLKYNDVYSSSRVHLICDDARDYLNHCHKKYDLIVLACLDSLAVTGLGSSVRIDSYVHTEESLKRVLSLLKPNGIFVMSFGAGGSHWLRDRLFYTLKAASGYDPLYLTDEHELENWPAFIYIAGEPVKNKLLQVAANYDGVRPEQITNTVTPKTLSDDWPYLYIAPSGIDIPYLLLILEISLLSVFAARNILFRKNSCASWQMFFLGSAFMLLELTNISRLSLLYGATWVTASIVINGVLCMILLANFLVIKYRLQVTKQLPLIFVLLFATLIGNYLLPMDRVVESAIPAARLGTTIIALLPMFLAGLIFASSFALLPDSPAGLAINILGSVFGALLELLSSYTGLKALLLIAFILYACAFVMTLKSTTLETKLE